MKTIQAPSFKTVNPHFKNKTDDMEDTLFTFEESNFVHTKDGILKSSVSKEQYTELYTHYFHIQRLFVEVHIRPNLKDGNHFFMMAGLQQIEEAFTGKYIYTSQKDYYIEYPERWLNLIELRLLLPLLHITYPNSLFHIKTHSVYLIQCTRNICIGIVDTHLSDIQDEISYEDFINGFVTCAEPPDETGIFVNGKQYKG